MRKLEVCMNKELKTIEQHLKFTDKLKELIELRIKIKKCNSFVLLSECISKNKNLRRSLKWIMSKLDGKTDEEKINLIRSRTLTAIDGLISTEAQKIYKRGL